MRFVLAGASGFIGSHLVEHLQAQGHDTLQLVRREPSDAKQRRWDPAGDALDPAALDGADVVVNLCGAGLTDRRWTQDYKRELVDSRVSPTGLLARTIAQLDRKPLFISQSAIGWYGHRDPSVELDESSSAGSGFLAAVCRRWEDAADPAREAGARVVHPRCGIVMGPGGALAQMAGPTKLGLGGRMGSGRQVVSWLALDDYAPALLHVATHPQLDGPVNFTAPNPLPQEELAGHLAAALGRPTLATAPGFAVRALLGEVADELLNGQCVVPRKLLASGYEFRCPCLRDVLEKYAQEL